MVGSKKSLEMQLRLMSRSEDARLQLFEKSVLSILVGQLSHQHANVKLSSLRIFTEMVRYGQSPPSPLWSDIS